MAKRKHKPKTMAETLRKACLDSGLTPYRIAKDGGTTPEVISRFINEGRDIRISTVDKIAGVLGLELKPKT